MNNEMTNIDAVVSAIREAFTVGNGYFRESRNAIVEYLIDEHITQGCYDSMDSLITDLEMAHCAAGSFSGMIYTQDILDRLSDPQWRDAIEMAVDSYTEAVGESPEFNRDSMGNSDIFRLENVVTFAVDWMSNEVANFLRSQDAFYLVTEAVDSCDPSPEVTVFLDEYEAQEHVSEAIQSRMDHLVQHATEAWSEEQREAIEQQESELFRIDEERV